MAVFEKAHQIGYDLFLAGVGITVTQRSATWVPGPIGVSAKTPRFFEVGVPVSPWRIPRPRESADDSEDCLREVFIDPPLAHVIRGACGQGFEGTLLILRRAEDDHGQRRVLPTDVPGCRDAVHEGHLDVNEDDVRNKRGGELDGLTPVPCNADDFKAPVLVEQRAEQPPVEVVVFGQEKTASPHLETPLSSDGDARQVSGSLQVRGSRPDRFREGVRRNAAITAAHELGNLHSPTSRQPRPVKGRRSLEMRATDDRETAELWRAELAAGRLPQNTEDVP